MLFCKSLPYIKRSKLCQAPCLPILLNKFLNLTFEYLIDYYWFLYYPLGLCPFEEGGEYKAVDGAQDVHEEIHLVELLALVVSLWTSKIRELH